jgi:hypothetical protein
MTTDVMCVDNPSWRSAALGRRRRQLLSRHSTAVSVGGTAPSGTLVTVREGWHATARNIAPQRHPGATSKGRVLARELSPTAPLDRHMQSVKQSQPGSFTEALELPFLARETRFGRGLIPPFAGGPLPLQATLSPRAAATRLVTFMPSPASKSCPGRKHKARETVGTVVN